MKEKEFIKIIKSTLNSKYIGDDCAFLKDLGIVVSSDNLVEGVHFLLSYTDAYKLGWKSAMVNLSDIAASGAEPYCMTVSLSIPDYIDEQFVQDFYRGIKDTGIEVVGGDITGGDKLFISITAIGKTTGRKISSRSSAKLGQKIIVSGIHGSSGAGLKELQNGIKDSKFVKAHLMPEAQLEFSKNISTKIKTDYAMMDTSDGLMDALEQIAEQSGVLMSIDFEKIPYDKDLEKFEDYRDLILYGGEDYQLVACVDFDVPNSFVIGEVKNGNGVEINGRKILNSHEKIYNHFKEQK